TANKKMKKYAAFFIAGIGPLATFVILVLTGSSVMMSMMVSLTVIILTLLIGSNLINTPWRQMDEGKGTIVITMDSTGQMIPFIVNVLPPDIKGRFFGRPIDSAWDREIAYTIKTPVEAPLVDVIQETEDGEVIRKALLIDEFEADNLFTYDRRTTLIYNQTTGDFVSKKYFDQYEHLSMVKHELYNIARKTTNIDENLRDFQRYIVQQIRRHGSSIFGDGGIMKFVIVIIVVCAIIGGIIMMSGGSVETGGIGGGSIINPLP
ncbi:MAG: hypothetical protein SVK08_11095, partial [Halobacteriota archaeon]|nr:hypothetical protein [Halobacteriota archaeon]